MHVRPAAQNLIIQRLNARVCRARRLLFGPAMTNDLRYAWRAMWKSPATTLGAMLALALGIGATTAVFGLFNAVLLRPLPYPHPERLVELYGNTQREVVERRGTSFPDFYDWRDQSRSFDGMALWTSSSPILYGSGEPESLNGEVISGPYFDLLGAEPLIGRVLVAADDERGGGARPAVISEGLWGRRFGRQPTVLGRSIQLNNNVFTIVGVVPAHVRGRSDQADVWTTASGTFPPAVLEQRGNRGFPVLARLKEGVSVATAQAELDGVSRRLEQAYPDTNEKRGVEVAPLAQEVFGDIRSAVSMLSVAVVLVLLIACANVASLMLARTEARRRELSVRLALGADKRRLARLMVAESAWLVVLGGGAGWMLALWATEGLLALSPVQLPSFAVPSVDWRMLLFMSGVAVVTTLGIGLLPVAIKSVGSLAQELREGSAESKGTARSSTLRVIVVGEVALAVALLVGATLLGRSLGGLMAFDPGFHTTGLLALGVQLPQRPTAASTPTDGNAPAGAGMSALAMLEALEGMSGVASAALFYAAEGRAIDDARTRPRAYVHRVTPGYFETIGLRLVRGRDFTARELGVDSTAVIVSEGVARRFWPGEDPIGRRVKRGSLDSESPWLTIVGVVEDANLRGIPRNPTADPDLYFPFNDAARGFAAVLRAHGSAADLTGPARETIRRVNSQAAVTTAETIETRVNGQLASVRFLSWLTGTFAALAFTLSVIGIYAVLAHSVRKRRREIGIRSALGAPSASVLTMVVSQGLSLVVVGLAIGVALSLGLSRNLQTWLYGVSTIDWPSYAAVAVIVLAASTLASLIPALRAVRIDPMIALRNE
jgi:predicted permease